MKPAEWMSSQRFGSLCVFIGSSALIGWTGLPVWMLLSGHPREAVGWLVGAFMPPLLPILSVVGLWWGLRTLRGKPSRGKCLTWALVPALALSPALGFIGGLAPIALRIFVINFILPDRIEQCAVSPDGRDVAYVLKKMTAGGWGQDFRLSVGGGKQIKVGYTGDFNRAHRIHWSPDSDIVVFEQQFNLLAVRMRDQETHQFDLAHSTGGDGYLHVHPLQRIEFPRPGVFVVCYGDETTSQTVDLTTR